MGLFWRNYDNDNKFICFCFWKVGWEWEYYILLHIYCSIIYYYNIYYSINYNNYMWLFIILLYILLVSFIVGYMHVLYSKCITKPEFCSHALIGYLISGYRSTGYILLVCKTQWTHTSNHLYFFCFWLFTGLVYTKTPQCQWIKRWIFTSPL